MTPPANEQEASWWPGLKLLGMTVTGRVCLAAISTLVVVIIFSTSMLLREGRAIQNLRLERDNHMAIGEMLAILEKDLSKVQVTVLNFKLTQNPRYVPQETLFADEIDGALEHLASMPLEAPLRERLSQVQQHTADYLQHVGAWSKTKTAVRVNPLMNLLGALDAECRSMAAENTEHVNATRAQLLAQVTRERNLLIINGALLVAMALALVGYAFSLLPPLNLLLEAIRRVEKGEDVRLPVNRHGELRELMVSFNQLTRANEDRRQRLDYERSIDGLTGLYNHRHFRSALEHHIQRIAGSSEVLSLLMIDIDHFKEHNDAMGHESGNKVLQVVSRTVKSELRATDILARYGGDELVAILPATEEAAAMVLAERIGLAISALYGQALERKVSLSIGGSTYAPAQSAEEFIQDADAALYEAKRGGRACVRWRSSELRWQPFGPPKCPTKTIAM